MWAVWIKDYFYIWNLEFEWYLVGDFVYIYVVGVYGDCDDFVMKDVIFEG